MSTQPVHIQSQYLLGYDQGAKVIKIWRTRGWAYGKGRVKQEISIIISCYLDKWNKSYQREVDRGFIDAILDSVN